jgi:hypothetical protein
MKSAEPKKAHFPLIISHFSLDVEKVNRDRRKEPTVNEKCEMTNGKRLGIFG